MVKRVWRFYILLVPLWCFVCLHVQEWQGRTFPSNTSVCVIFFVVLPYILYMARMVMPGGDGARAE